MCGTKRQWIQAELDVMGEIVDRIRTNEGDDVVHHAMLDLLTHNRLHEILKLKQEDELGIL